jgi:hypothetical protein
MHIRPLLAASALLLGAVNASAQFVELLTEAPVTVSATLTTSVTTVSPTARSTTQTNTTLNQAAVIADLQSAGIIPGTSTTGWSLVAVRSAAPDLEYVDATFYFYAVNTGLNTRVFVPSLRFAASSFASAARYTERHQGQYVYSSAGSRFTHVAYDYRPAFSAAGGTFAIQNSQVAGLARIDFVARDLADGFEVVFFAIPSLRVTARGGFEAAVSGGSGNPEGIMTLSIATGAPKLVPASLYPDVPTL